jgi:hypothetical protein
VVSVTPRPRLSAGESTPGTYCTGGWVGPRAGLDTEAIGKILCLCRGSNLDSPSPALSPTLYWLSYSGSLTCKRRSLKGDVNYQKGQVYAVIYQQPGQLKRQEIGSGGTSYRFIKPSVVIPRILGRLAWGVWIGFDCLRTGTGGGLLWVRWWIFGFLRQGVSYTTKYSSQTYFHRCCCFGLWRCLGLYVDADASENRSSILEAGTGCFSETLVSLHTDFTRRHNPEEHRNLHCRKNSKPHTSIFGHYWQ